MGQIFQTTGHLGSRYVQQKKQKNESQVRKTEEAIREEYHRIIEESKKAAEMVIFFGNFPLEGSHWKCFPRISQFPIPWTSASFCRKLVLNPRHPLPSPKVRYLDPKNIASKHRSPREVFAWMSRVCSPLW